jgi:hypothetical protein
MCMLVVELVQRTLLSCSVTLKHWVKHRCVLPHCVNSNTVAQDKMSSHATVKLLIAKQLTDFQISVTEFSAP